MLAHLLFHERSPGSREAIVRMDGATTWSVLSESARAMCERLSLLGKRRVGLCLQPTPTCFAALAVLDELASDVFLMDGDLAAEEAEAVGRELRLGAIVARANSEDMALDIKPVPDEDPGSGQSTVTILTSGTTGKPKAARHTWESLARPVRRSAEDTAPRWLLTYRPNLYAGLQVILQCLCNHGTLVVADAAADPKAVCDLLVRARVQYASATPSYWRRLLLFGDPGALRKANLIQITLGGEAVDQHVLDMLRSQLPQARLVHIFATTELGRCFSVTDGRAGFPAEFMQRPSPDGVQLRIETGELLVRSANAMQAYDPRSGQSAKGEWFATGDLVEQAGDRVYFVGRKSDMINVGGNKVHPLEVERVIRGVPGVADVRVFGRRSSVAGELVACEIVVAADAQADVIRDAVAAACVDSLQAYQRPRLIEIVPHIVLSDTGKKIRRSPA